MAKILVTGADGGIGSLVIKTLQDAGHEVLGSTMNDTDLTKPKDVHELAKRVGKVDWVVCAHGYIDTETVLEQQDTQEIETTFTVNTLSLFWLVKEFTNTNFLALSSSAGLAPNGKFAAYSASKAAVNAFIQAMARNKPHLQFLAIAPGPTNTATSERVAQDAAKMQSPLVIAQEILKIIAGKSDYKSGDIILIKDEVATIAIRA